MADLSELFAADHATALKRAVALDAGDAPDSDASVELTDLTAIDLETLGEIAADVVRFGVGDLELDEVDLDHENLFEVPPFFVDLLVELGRTDDPDALADVCERWAATTENGLTAEDLKLVLSDIVGVATSAHRLDRQVYLWTEPLS